MKNNNFCAKQQQKLPRIEKTTPNLPKEQEFSEEEVKK